jgi:hypothetical protein
MKLDYYDNITNTFTRSQQQPSFAHLFPLKLPPNSPYLPFETVYNNWPTSNRTLAA